MPVRKRKVCEVIYMEKEKAMAIEIMDIFEHSLEEKGVKIPSDDREGRIDEACIYGREYYEIEDKITNTIKTHKDDIKQEIRGELLEVVKESTTSEQIVDAIKHL